ncbi:amidohydrolase family protein [Bradyrhizobium liaoningense]|uniref:amidohydrolase family protein n=1 Tax=Bradyrhizobium liaoningense TaxID=43992 RepID=UPI0028998698|nr:amidohydrolase family protein [Bradyrhizobium liaoningense]
MIYGKPATEALREEAERLGAKRVYLIASRTLNTTTDEIEKIRAALGARHAATFDGVPQHTTRDVVTQIARQRNGVFQRGINDEKNLPKLLTTRDVLEFATIEGARANKLDRKVGTLTPGKEADLILLRTDRPNVAPVNNAIGAVVTNMHPGNVDTVMVSGRMLKRNGQLVGCRFRQSE